MHSMQNSPTSGLLTKTITQYDKYDKISTAQIALYFFGLNGGHCSIKIQDSLVGHHRSQSAIFADHYGEIPASLTLKIIGPAQPNYKMLIKAE